MSAVAEAVESVDWPDTLRVPLDTNEEVAVIDPNVEEDPRSVVIPPVIAVRVVAKRLVVVALVSVAFVAVRLVTIAVTAFKRVAKKLVLVLLVVVKLLTVPVVAKSVPIVPTVVEEVLSTV